MKYFLAVAFILFLLGDSHAIDRYVAPGGSGSACTSGSPCTWATAIGATGAGDTILLKNGTHAPISISGLNGNSGARITIKAENERQAHLIGGASATLKIENSSWLSIEGLYLEMGDITPHNWPETPFLCASCTNVNFKKNLLNKSNRTSDAEGHMMELNDSSNILIEDNELYNYIRHGIVLQNSLDVTIRRNYCNPRNYPGLAGSNRWVGGACISLYPGGRVTVENNIAESSNYGGHIAGMGSPEGDSNGGQLLEVNNAWTTPYDAKIYGNVELRGGSFFGSRSQACADGTVAWCEIQNFFIKDFITVIPGNLGGSGSGLRMESARNARCDNCSFFSAQSTAFTATESGYVPGYNWNSSLVITNTLFHSNGGGIYVSDPTLASWNVDFSRFWNNGSSSPAESDSHITNRSTTDPSMGGCYLWQPDGSNLIGTGLAKANIGARMLYRYIDGVQQVTQADRLWSPTTGVWLWGGAVVSGVNSDTSNSLNGVHTRLHVGAANGCAFPSGYGVAGPIVTIQKDGGKGVGVNFTTSVQNVDIFGTASGTGF